MSDPERGADLNAAFSAIMGEAWPEGDFPYGDGADQVDDTNSEFATILRRSRFLADVMNLYPDESDVPGYSHRQILHQVEGFALSDFPTEEDAILYPRSSVNAFLDEVLAATDYLSNNSSNMDRNKLAAEHTSVKLTFASEAWHDYEVGATWLTRLIDLALRDGVSTAAMQPADIDMELFLCTGRTAADTGQYDALGTHLTNAVISLLTNTFKDTFPEFDEVQELAVLATEWGVKNAVYRHEIRDKNILLTQEARSFLGRQRSDDEDNRGLWLHEIAESSGVTSTELISRLLPLVQEIQHVAHLRLRMDTEGDSIVLSPEEQDKIDMWFPTILGDDFED